MTQAWNIRRLLPLSVWLPALLAGLGVGGYVLLTPEADAGILLAGIALLIAGIALSLLLWLVKVRHTTQQLAQIVTTLERVREGDYRVRLPEDGGGELVNLLRAVNAMIETVGRSHDSLHEQIEQATADLRQTLEAVEIKNVELDLARKRALEASRVKSEFLANISHEIRTPMNAIIGFTQLLDKTRLDADQAQYVRTIARSAESLLKLLDDVLILTRIETGRIAVERGELEPVELVETVLASAAQEAYAKGLEIAAIFAPDLPARVTGDAAKLQLILANLVSNAVKFTERGAVSVSVRRVESSADRATLRFEVADTGIGIAVEEQERLFDSFTRGGNVITDTQGGAGLGLAICRRLVESLEGTIAVESRPGAGSRFTVTLPFIDPVPSSHDTRLAGLRAAVCDESAEARAACETRLLGWGVHVESFARFDDLVREMAQRHKDATPDFVVLGLSHVQTRFPENLVALWRDVPQPPPRIALATTLDRAQQRRIGALLGCICLPKCADGASLFEELVRLHETRTAVAAPVKTVPSAAPASRTPSRPSVLIVDDNRVNCRLALDLLATLGAAAVSAHDAETALTALETERPEVILLDLRLGKEDGRALLPRLRALAGDRPLRIYACSANPLSEAEAKAAGFDGVLNKPLDSGQLQALLGRAADIPIPPMPPTKPGGNAVKNALAALDPTIRTMLSEDLPAQLTAIDAAVKSADWPRVRDLAHAVHGSAAFCKLEALKIAAAKLESAAGGAADREKIHAAYRAFCTEIQTVTALLQAGIPSETTVDASYEWKTLEKKNKPELP